MKIIDIENNGSMGRYSMVSSIRRAEAEIDYLDDRIKPIAIDQLKKVASYPVSGRFISGMIDACVNMWKEDNKKLNN